MFDGSTVRRFGNRWLLQKHTCKMYLIFIPLLFLYQFILFSYFLFSFFSLFTRCEQGIMLIPNLDKKNHQILFSSLLVSFSAFHSLHYNISAFPASLPNSSQSYAFFSINIFFLLCFNFCAAQQNTTALSKQPPHFHLLGSFAC